MKTISTSKGEFVVVDATTLDKVSGQALVDEYGDYIILSEATEEDAKLIVDEYNWTDGFKVYHNYTGKQTFNTFTAIDSLHSLLKSNNITGDNLYIFQKV